MANNNNIYKEGLKGYCRIRGLSLEILLLLGETPLTTLEISLLLEKPPNYVRSYLYRLRKHGYINNIYGYWYVEEKVRENIERLRNLVGKGDNVLNVDNLSRKYQLSVKSREALRKLIENYLRTGMRRKYMLFQNTYEVEEYFNTRGEELRDVLLELMNKGIIYYVTWKGLIKIGLMQGFLEEAFNEMFPKLETTNTTTTNKNTRRTSTNPKQQK